MDELHVHSDGDPDAPAVLFLHGFLGSSVDWIPIVRKLASAYYCICPDLPGHGRSIGLEEPYSMRRTAALLGNTLDRLSVAQAHVVGYSMGGRTALFAACHSPERVGRVVLESASPGLASASARSDRRRVDEDRARAIVEDDFHSFVEGWYRQPLFETYRRHEGLLDRMIHSRKSNVPFELARSLRGMGTGSQPSLWPHLRTLDSSVLLLAGADDAKYVALAEQMASLIPDARSVIFPHAGHTVHAEQPEAYADIIMDFLTKTLD